MQKIRWGVLGPGSIAKQFARGLQVLPDAELVAVGSRSLEKAQAFAAEFKASRVYGSYEALAADPEVDAIYVATPHPFHHANSLMCLKAKKAVLCEKPFTINAVECAELIACARQEKVFLMEAMWTRFLPTIVKVRDWLDQKAIGEPRMVQADFGFRAEVEPDGRLFNLALGGGALRDVGVYPISFNGKPAETVILPLEATGYNYEAAEVGRCLRAGLTESAVMPLDESLVIMQTMDELRRQWGLVYPGEMT
jgi:predicted dehydrogenase